MTYIPFAAIGEIEAQINGKDRNSLGHNAFETGACQQGISKVVFSLYVYHSKFVEKGGSVQFSIFIGLLFCFVSASQLSAADPVFIVAQHNVQSRTQNIIPHITYLESLPFDGMTINTPESWSAMSPNYSVDSITFWNSWLKPLNGIFKKFNQNYLVVFVDKPADFFDDWSKVIRNWELIAEGAASIGCVGLSFDNEEYTGKLWTYPDDVSQKTKTLDQYRTQAALRGKQIMQAVCARFPKVKMHVYHGPYVSEVKTPLWVTMDQAGRNYEDLRGAFFAGMLEGLGAQASLTDGGEVYSYRTALDFERSYQWRKNGMASDSTNCPFIPPALRPVWKQKVNISYGVYNLGWPDSVKNRMNPSIMRTTVERALRRSDGMAWLFLEGTETWLQPGGMPQAWQDSIRAGVMATRGSTGTSRRKQMNPYRYSRSALVWNSSGFPRLMDQDERFIDLNGKVDMKLKAGVPHSER